MLVSRECVVTLSITPADGGEPTTRELGGFREVWRKGVSIGRDGWCDVSLPGLAPVAAIVLAGSNHKLLYLPGSPGFAEAFGHAGGQIPEYDARIDYSVFVLGPYRLQFGGRHAGDGP